MASEVDWLGSNDPAAMLYHAQNIYTKTPTGFSVTTRTQLISDRKLRLFACACVRQVWHLLTDDAECFRCRGSGSYYVEQEGFATRCEDCGGSGRINRSRRGVEVAERRAEGESELLTPAAAYHAWLVPQQWEGENERGLLAARQAAWCTDPTVARAAQGAFEFGNESPVPLAVQAALLREIVGNSWRPVRLPHAASCPWHVGPKTVTECGCRCDWLTPTVVGLAEAAYACRAEPRKCGRCVAGQVIVPGTTWAPSPCLDCCGTGSICDGTLDPDRLGVLADALEEAGCDSVELLLHLRGKMLIRHEVHVTVCRVSVHHRAKYGDGWGAYVAGPNPKPPAFVERRREVARARAEKEFSILEWRHSKPFNCFGRGADVMEIVDLKAPHFRGCWALDLILGRS
jgi:hypothetical protein